MTARRFRRIIPSTPLSAAARGCGFSLDGL